MRTGRRDWMWGLALGVAALAGAGVIFTLLRGEDVKTYAEIAGVKCQSGEQLEYHVHAHLSVLIDGEPVIVPGNTGIRDECLFWLHTHEDSGLVHVEAPEDAGFTLGHFFAVWGEPLSDTELLDHVADAEHQIIATVNGQPFEGDPSTIALDDKQTIVLQYGPPFGTPAPSPFED